MTFKELSAQLHCAIKKPNTEKTAEEKQQEFNAMVALAIAEQDRRLIELSNGGADNG